MLIISYNNYKYCMLVKLLLYKINKALISHRKIDKKRR